MKFWNYETFLVHCTSHRLVDELATVLIISRTFRTAVNRKGFWLFTCFCSLFNDTFFDAWYISLCKCTCVRYLNDSRNFIQCFVTCHIGWYWAVWCFKAKGFCWFLQFYNDKRWFISLVCTVISKYLYLFKTIELILLEVSIDFVIMIIHIIEYFNGKGQWIDIDVNLRRLIVTIF